MLNNNIEPAFNKTPNIKQIGEDRYIKSYVYRENLKKFNKRLPKVNEAALALLTKNVSFNNDQKVYKWKDDAINYFKKDEAIVIGLFGDVSEEDFNTVAKILVPLKKVAPNLNIFVSEDKDRVTLPIHFYPCNKLLSLEFNDCGGKWDGIYYGSSWIWIDSSENSLRRAHVIIHEIGHALGLGHNLCRDSVMSYAKYSNEPTYFDQIDLMQLQLIHHPAVNKKELLNIKDLEDFYINKFDLNKEIINQYKRNPMEACSVTNSEWEQLINMQEQNNEKVG